MDSLKYFDMQVLVTTCLIYHLSAHLGTKVNLSLLKGAMKDTNLYLKTSAEYGAGRKTKKLVEKAPGQIGNYMKINR